MARERHPFELPLHHLVGNFSQLVGLGSHFQPDNGSEIEKISDDSNGASVEYIKGLFLHSIKSEVAEGVHRIRNDEGAL